MQITLIPLRSRSFLIRRPVPNALTLACVVVLAVACSRGACAQSENRFGRVVVPVRQTVPEESATSMLVEEAARRTASGDEARIDRGPGAIEDAKGEATVVLAQRQEVSALLPTGLAKLWEKLLRGLPAAKPEGFSVASLRWHGGEVVVIAGNDERGVLFGAGWLLRQMRFASGEAEIPAGLQTTQAPEKPVRGHQIGYRFKNNTYDAWTLPQFEQQIRDLAVFGANTIQLIAPNSDDAATSPLNPAPPLQTLLGISALLKKYGLDCDLYYPEMRPDYTKPEQVEAELKDFEALVKAMPRLDALYVPGGDPGHTSAAVLFPLVEREAAILHRYQPKATVWVSGQGFDREGYAQFYALLKQNPRWLTGVFFGPQSRDSFAMQRRNIPTRYAMQFYPDIGHTMHAQFPVPEWDPIYALTEGREPICPRPAAFTAIYRHFEGLHSGFVTYSEGVNDDVNKMLWNQLGWSSKTAESTFLGEYARYFLHTEGGEQAHAVAAIEGLEEDWQGPLAANRQIARTLEALHQLENHAKPHNWRFESLLYRGTYDDYLQRKLRRERASEAAALAALEDNTMNASERVRAARAALANSKASGEEQREHDALFTLAGELFHDAGLQLSVKLYGASNWERGANLDRVDTPLNDAAWLSNSMTDALQQPDEAARVKALEAIAHWSDPVPGTLYDDLGDATHEPHLVRGAGWQEDPEMYDTAIDGIADRTLAAAAKPWRLSWLSYAETLYETPLQLRYTALDRRRRYRVRVTYAGEDYALPLRLMANGTTEIQPARLRSSNPETVEYPVPQAATASGDLTLQWTGPKGSGGSGRGRQVAEVWLIPQP